MGAVHKPHPRLEDAKVAPSSFRRSQEPQQAKILVTETRETTVSLSTPNTSIPKAASAAEHQPDRHRFISDLALRHAIKYCLEDMSGLLKAANVDLESHAALSDRLDKSDSESLKALRTDVLHVFTNSLLPHVSRKNQSALPSIDHLPERLVETIGALLSSRQLEGATTSVAKTQPPRETNTSTLLTDLNLILSAYSERMSQYAHPDSMTSTLAPGLVHIHWPAEQGISKEIKAIVLSTSGGLAEQETAHRAAQAMEPNSPVAVRVAPIDSTPLNINNRPSSIRSSADQKQGIEESDATHKLLAFIEHVLNTNNVNPQNAKGYVEAPLRLPISLTHAAAIADFKQRWPEIEIYIKPRQRILDKTQVQDWDIGTEIHRNGKRQVFDMLDGNVCMSELHYQDVIHRRNITQQARLELASFLNIHEEKIKFQPLNEKTILSNEVTVEIVKGDYAFIPVPGQRQGGDRFYIKATFAELGVGAVTAGQKILLDRTRRVSRSHSPSGAGNPSPPPGHSR